MNVTRGRAKTVDLIGLIVRAERTVIELVGLTGMVPDNVRSWLALLVEEGLVRVVGTRRTGESKQGPASRVYRWVGHAD
jgi:DNA-binding IclR family transcriptional regulator